MFREQKATVTMQFNCLKGLLLGQSFASIYIKGWWTNPNIDTGSGIWSILEQYVWSHVAHRIVLN